MWNNPNQKENSKITFGHKWDRHWVALLGINGTGTNMPKTLFGLCDLVEYVLVL